MPDKTTPLRLILYIDEVNPGNPLRPDKGRGTQAIYWCFADWPQWALQRSSVWLLFGVVRTTLVEELPAGESQLMKAVMNVFFSKTGHSFTNGCLIHHGQDSVLVRAVFKGFLADEKAHKEIWASKGASGTKPCLSCKNVTRFLEVSTDPYLVGIDCVEQNRLDKHTNESVYAMVDRLQAAKAEGMAVGRFKRLEQVLGISHNVEGILYDQHLRSILRPVDNTLRDWMHCFVSGGVAGTEMSLLIQELRTHGVKEDMLIAFNRQFHFPRARGKLPDSCWSDLRVNDDQLRSFASEQLGMVPILACFMTDVIRPMGILPDHIRCFLLLHKIIDFLSMGTHSSMKYVGALRDAIVYHNSLFRRLYEGSVKPKFHHTMHIPENMSFVGALMSCFVTERKHRSVKKGALTIFRHYEHTLLATMVNQQAEHFLEGSVLNGYHLGDAREFNAGGAKLLMSKVAVLPCGEVHVGDVLAFEGGYVGKTEAFWQQGADMVVQVAAYRRASPDGTTWSSTGATTFIQANTLLAPLIWAAKSDGVKIIRPRVWCFD